MAKRNGISINLAGVEAGGRKVPEGEYIVEVTSFEEKESSNGNPGLSWKWKVVEGDYKGATIWDNTSLLPQALWRLKNLLDCLGIDTSGEVNLVAKEILGKRALVEISIETYQGKERSRITQFLKGVGGSGTSRSTPAPVAYPPKGSKVTFDFEGSPMDGVVTSNDGKKAIVLVEVDGGKEEWELSPSELTVTE